jgi:hypothetical protein
MKTIYQSILTLCFAICTISAIAQEEETPSENYRSYQIKTVFNNNGKWASGGYAALGNKFSTINGNYANIVEFYGGWYVGHRFLIGIEAASTTNDIRVPAAHSIDPTRPMSYEYAQCGLMTEYVIASDRVMHVAFQMFGGAGFTAQYDRYGWQDNNWDNYDNGLKHDENLFAVAEPGVQLEMNIFKWLRFSPGVSYRMAFGSTGSGLTDKNLSSASVNMTLKVGKF